MSIRIRRPRAHARIAMTRVVTAVFLLAPATAGAASRVHTHGTWFGYESDDRDGTPTFAYAKVDPQTDAIPGGTNSGGLGTLDHARRREHDSALWFRLAGKSYLVHDRPTLRRADELMAPERRLEPEVARLDSLEQLLEDQQSSLEDDQQRWNERRAGLEAESLRLEAAEAHSNRTARDNTARQRARLDTAERDLERQAADLDHRRGSLDARRGLLSRQQQQLSIEQEKLSHEATAGMRRLVDEAISHHLAERVTD
jgi:hypothetical protein